jgi:hypothetical protein
MGIEFTTRHPNAVYFPTVHIHDGQVHPTEHFDHSLYLQGTGPHGRPSSGPVETYVDVARTRDIVRAGAPCQLVEMRGDFANRDIFLGRFGDPMRLILPAAVVASAGLAVSGTVRARKSRNATG